MWINQQLYDALLANTKELQTSVEFERLGSSRMSASMNMLREQKVKDDLTIDWMRHRVNALEKQNAQLLMKVAGITLPVPEIVPTRPGSMSPFIDFDSMPSFEDVGDAEAARLGLDLDASGQLVYTGKQ